MCEALFDCAHRLFGLKFIHRSDLAAYHPDVQVYEVHEADADGNDTLRAIFLHDNYSRANKQGGAWMSEYRSQCRNFTLSSSLGSSALRHDSKGGNVVPIIVNNNNFNKAPQGQKTLLSFDDAVTLFHEFGHGLHGMLSDVVYRKLSGTSVLRDFLELPSQLLEHWLSQPEVLKKHARHFETNQPIPDEYITKLKAAQRFNVGFDTVEYLSSCFCSISLCINWRMFRALFQWGTSSERAGEARHAGGDASSPPTTAFSPPFLLQQLCQCLLRLSLG